MATPDTRADDPLGTAAAPYGAPDGSGASKGGKPHPPIEEDLEFILDIPLEVTVELGRTRMIINDLLKLGQGSVIELTKAAGETLEVLANQKLIARGEVVSVNDSYGVRITEIISPLERVKKLK